MGFIEELAGYVCKYAPQYNIMVHSPIIAQGILESASGTSELAVNACNYFGMKYRANRCPTACGIYYKVGSEQNADGSYTSSAMQWMMFENMEQCVIGYFDFINIKNYANLKGVADPKTYLETIKADGYATSLKYVDNLMAVIEKYDLTKYDNNFSNNSNSEGESAMAIIALDAGHGMNTAGKRCMSTIDSNQTREWYLNDRIMDRVQELLAGYECKVVRTDDTTGAKDISLASRVSTANNAKADIFVSMHHDSGINGGTGGGTTVFYYSTKADRQKQATKLYNTIIKYTGLIGNRSTKVKNYAYYVLKNTNMPAFLVENGFMDSQTDTPVILTAEHAEKTAQGVVSFLADELSLAKKKGAVSGNQSVQTGNNSTSSSNTSANTSTASTYTVEKGDTLYSIGNKTGVAWQTIAELNGIKAPYTIKKGQVLKLTEEFYPAYTGKNTTLVAAMTSLGINSTYAFRKKIAAANNITLYRGTAAQNTQMYNLLKAGLLKKA